MKIGIWLGRLIPQTMGGGATYTSRLIQLIDDYNFNEEVEICYLSLIPQKNLKNDVVVVSQLPSFLYKIVHNSTRLSYWLNKLDTTIIKHKGLHSILRNTDIKIVYYSSQNFCLDTNFPFIATNWDIGHRSTHAFPELTGKGEYEAREDYYRNVLPKALMVVCESETGRRELVQYTNIGEHKIRIMPLFSGNVTALHVDEEKMNILLDQIGLSNNHFFYYPAQFWAHKNHVGLIRAFNKFCKEYNSEYRLVLSGSDKGNLVYIRKLVEDFGLNDNVLILGFISEEMVYSLYKNSLCLIMASHFGPTNMPVIEAMELGCPVLCSNLGGHREILGENAVFFDSYNYISIYKAMVEIVENRQDYLSRIIKQKSLSWFNSDSAVKCLDTILQEAITIRNNWQ